MGGCRVVGVRRRLPHAPPADIPQPSTADTWAADMAIAYSGSFSHAPLANIPQAEAPDAWAADGVMAHNGSNLALPSSSNVGRNSRADPCTQARTPLLPRRCGISAGAQPPEAAVSSSSCTGSHVQEQKSLYQGNYAPVMV